MLLTDSWYYASGQYLYQSYLPAMLQSLLRLREDLSDLMATIKRTGIGGGVGKKGQREETSTRHV